MLVGAPIASILHLAAMELNLRIARESLETFQLERQKLA